MLIVSHILYIFFKSICFLKKQQQSLILTPQRRLMCSILCFVFMLFTVLC